MIAIQSLSSRQGVWFHVLCGELHTHNTFRAADSLSDKGMICDYVDRAWLIFEDLSIITFVDKCRTSSFTVNGGVYVL